MRRRPTPLRPDRVRRLEKPFGWVPLRLLRSELLAAPSAEATLLYLFLSLVADRQGLSFWSEERLSRQLGLPTGALALGRAELCRRDLVAFDGWLYQVLSLPEKVGVTKASGPALGVAAPSRPPLTPGRGEAASPEAVGQILRRLRQQLGWDEDEQK